MVATEDSVSAILTATNLFLSTFIPIFVVVVVVSVPSTAYKIIRQRWDNVRRSFQVLDKSALSLKNQLLNDDK